MAAWYGAADAGRVASDVRATMTILVTGSSGHLGEALMRTLREAGREALGLDVVPGAFTDVVGSIADRPLVARCLAGVRAVLHAATLHKPHVATHGREDFVETNVLGTLVLLEEAARAGVESFVMTSTTSAFGDALKPPPGEPAAWIDEERRPGSKEHLRRHQDRCRGPLPALLAQRGTSLRHSADVALLPRAGRRSGGAGGLRRRQPEGERVSLPPGGDRGRRRGASPRASTARLDRVRQVYRQRHDAVPARGRRAPENRCGGGRARARSRAGRTNMRAAAGAWRSSIDRIYDNALARRELGWRPKWDFAAIVARLRRTGDIRGPLAKADRREGLSSAAVPTSGSLSGPAEPDSFQRREPFDEEGARGCVRLQADGDLVAPAAPRRFRRALA